MIKSEKQEIKKSPLVSVIIPLYNYEKYVADCIDSIVKQDYENIEIVLIDNASTDNGLKIATNKLRSCISSNIKYNIIENSNKKDLLRKKSCIKKACSKQA